MFQPPRSSNQTPLPGLTRQSIVFATTIFAEEMAPRVKPAGDGRGMQRPVQTEQKSTLLEQLACAAS
jgi:hypothetical protein